AAQMADAHDMIAHLPAGYDTEIGEAGTMLSPGQRQRIALARALFGRPVLVVLDEPNSNLDSDGDEALGNALANLRKNGTTVIIITHRMALLNAVDEVLALQQGAVLAYGTPQDVLNRLRRPVAPRVPSATPSAFSVLQRP
ncbi:MAG TPA: ATP-binding cassette domain-containing protein, partial [Burkholderiales bacterium]|nr:ATP-binding cassette domain-containing protein [Burkholderiales bacterium]